MLEMIQPRDQSISCSVARHEGGFVSAIYLLRTGEVGINLIYEKEEGSCMFIYSRAVAAKTLILRFRQFLFSLC